MELIIHAGMHKTGTTSVQKWLDNHASDLARHRILALPLEKRILVKDPQSFDADSLKNDLRIAEEMGIQKVIISHEEISTFSMAQTRTLSRVLEPYPLKFVVCFRHWVNFLPSRWRQNCIRRDSASFPNFLEILRSKPERCDFQMHRVLRNAEESGDHETVVIPFETAAKIGGVPRHILSACGVPELLLKANDPNALRLNTESGQKNIEMIRLLNGVYARSYGLRENEMLFSFGANSQPKEYFDFGLNGFASKFLASYPEIHDELGRMLESRQTLIRLSRSDFADLESDLERHARSHTALKLCGDLFPEIEAKDILCSKLEYIELPETFQTKIVKAIDRYKKRLRLQERWVRHRRKIKLFSGT
ncbi:hypothetical protein SAMN05444398_11929 [Roseovarius pacificus]|uniref:Sulfotransferase family protein n=1 Tax=Roseovarius pacificus TaxID=337701 RepID=A0A1M7JBY4_9RHOB|nr:hypothetical protein [Roseovarius pacificus]SHM50505.1 hypothetical protein SAMN05444398_11929 [Roseovarius pacificus]